MFALVQILAQIIIVAALMSGVLIVGAGLLAAASRLRSTVDPARNAGSTRPVRCDLSGAKASAF